MTTQRDLTTSAKKLAQVLAQRKLCIVFAESCTGGLVSNALTRIAGISEWHCGSAVVYQVETKAQWLGIDPAILVSPGPVSQIVAQLMAENVLAKTPQADVAASITGHLGPNAPAKQDGLIFVGITLRSGASGLSKTRVIRRVLESGEEGVSGVKLRNQRQLTAAAFVLDSVRSHLGSTKNLTGT